MKYSLCQFNYGYEGTFYQESGLSGLVRFVDLDGNTMILIPPYGYEVINDSPDFPSWGII
jgi:hypothetical protein